MKFACLLKLFKMTSATQSESQEPSLNVSDLVQKLKAIKADLPKQNHLLMEEQIVVFNSAMRKGIAIDSEVFQAYGDTMEAKALEEYKSLPAEEKEKIDRRNKNAQSTEELSQKFKAVDDYVAKHGTIIGYPYGANLELKL